MLAVVPSTIAPSRGMAETMRKVRPIIPRTPRISSRSAVFVISELSRFTTAAGMSSRYSCKLGPFNSA